MASSDYLPDYVLRCPTCGLVYRLSYEGARGDLDEGEVPIDPVEAVALVLSGAVSAGTCDTCYASQVNEAVRRR